LEGEHRGGNLKEKGKKESSESMPMESSGKRQGEEDTLDTTE